MRLMLSSTIPYTATSASPVALPGGDHARQREGEDRLAERADQQDLAAGEAVDGDADERAEHRERQQGHGQHRRDGGGVRLTLRENSTNDASATWSSPSAPWMATRTVSRRRNRRWR